MPQQKASINDVISHFTRLQSNINNLFLQLTDEIQRLNREIEEIHNSQQGDGK
jgi:hypothetical protein